jgi:hypothetical protein
MATENEYVLNDDIEYGARDELPETFDALVQSIHFGTTGLARRKSLVMARIWGKQLDDAEITALDPRVTTYAAKMLARTLIGPGIDYWSNQVLTQSAGTTEQVSYDAQRVAALKDADKRLAAELGELLPDVEVILPPVGMTVGAAPHVGQAGRLGTTGAMQEGEMGTPYPYDFPPVYGPPEDNTAAAG